MLTIYGVSIILCFIKILYGSRNFCFNFAYCDHGNERYTMGVNFLQISCMLMCKNEANLVNVIFTMTLLITLRVRKSVFSSLHEWKALARV